MVDPELLYNFARVRPLTRMDTSGTRVIDWPGIELKRSTFADHDLLLLAGEEPQYRWQTTATQIAEYVADLGCELAISLGAVNGLIPHTRDFPVYAYTTDDELAQIHGIEQPEYEGPTGYMAAVNAELAEVGIPSISVRVEVPHYLPTPPSPKGVRALLKFLQRVIGFDTFANDLNSDVAEWENLVTQAVEVDDENAAYVAQLEQQFDSEEELNMAGHDLVIELESYLRDSDSTDEKPPESEPDDTDEESND
jgi:proteasome assembly chaperone (PAC2) family protein